MDTSFLDNFVLPDGAREDLDRQGFKMRSLEPGVSVMDGHDKGVPYRFFRLVEKDEAKSKAAGFTVHRSEDCIEWLKSKRMHCVERVRFLPPGLINIDEEGNITGAYSEAYKRYLSGKKSPGLELNKWGQLDDASIADLNAINVFTVEQFAEFPTTKFDRMGQVIKDAHSNAIQWVRGQAGRFEAEKQAGEIVKLQGEIAKLEEKLNATVAKKPKGRPKKEVEVAEYLGELA